MKFRQTESTSSGKTQPKPGTHVARLLGIIDIGLRPPFVYEGKDIQPEYKLELVYELVNSNLEDGRPHVVSEEVTNKLSREGAKLETKLTKRIAALNGDMRDPRSMLNQACIVTVKQKEGGWAKIDSVGGVPEGLPVKPLVNPTFFFDLEDPNLELFNSFPEFRRNKIMDNLEFVGSKLQELIDKSA